MLNIIKDLLEKIINDIDAGNSTLTEEDQIKIINCLKDLSSPEISKYTACNLLHMSRSKFDEYVKQGKLPKGEKRQGFKELFWNKNKLLRHSQE